MDLPVPSSTPVSSADAMTIAEERLQETQWWLPETAIDLAVINVDDSLFRDIQDIAIITFHADRDDVLAMVPKGRAYPFYQAGDKLNMFQKQMLSVVGAPEYFQFASANTQTYPPHLNVLILPDEEENTLITILSYYQVH